MYINRAFYRWLVLLLVFCWLTAPSLAIAAGGDDEIDDRWLNVQNKAKKEGGKSKKSQSGNKSGYEEEDPYAGRVDIGLGGGYVYSNAGGGGEFNLTVTYHFNYWMAIAACPGFGLYPLTYDSPDQENDMAWVKYIPFDVYLLFTPYRGRMFTFYVGPGVGYHYTWWTEKTNDPDDPTKTIEEDYDHGAFSGSIRAGIGVGLGHGFGTSLGVSYTVPDLSDFNLDDALISFGVGGGVSF